MGMHQPAWHTRLPHKTTHLQSVIVMAHKTSKTAAVMIQRIHGHRRANRYFCFCHTIPGCYWGTLSHFTTRTSVLKVWLWHSFHMIHIFFPYWKDKYDISSGKSDIFYALRRLIIRDEYFYSQAEESRLIFKLFANYTYYRWTCSIV